VYCPHSVFLMNLQTLTVEVALWLRGNLGSIWDSFIRLLESIPSRHLRVATFATRVPSKLIPKGNAEAGWAHAESVITKRPWGPGEPGVAKVCLRLQPLASRSEIAYVDELRQRLSSLINNGWIGFETS
jgi:hypothetical protein